MNAINLNEQYNLLSLWRLAEDGRWELVELLVLAMQSIAAATMRKVASMLSCRAFVLQTSTGKTI